MSGINVCKFFRSQDVRFKILYLIRKYANVIQSAQELGNCFTIFRRSEDNFLKSIAIKSGFSQSPVLQGVGDALKLEISEQPFSPNEIFRIMVNFSIREYTALNEKISGQIMIHDENELPAIRERNFHIYPGYYYEFYVTKETGQYLPSPYVTDCINYDLHKSDSNSSSHIPVVLTRETCIMNCLADKTVELCQCWPPELPYIYSNSSEERLKWCNWRDGHNIVTTNSNASIENVNWFRFCFGNNEAECRERCKTQCL